MAEKTNELTIIGNTDLAAATGKKDDPVIADPLPPEAAVDALEETEHLKSQIVETRQQMGETIDAIQERLSFSNISEQVSEQVNNAIETAKDTVYDATIGKAVNYMKHIETEVSGTAVVKMVRKNPLPFILIAAGAGLLVYNSFGPGSTTARGQGRRKEADDSGVEENGRSRSMMDSAKEKVNGLADGVSGAAGSAYESVRSAAAGTYAGIANSAGNAYTGAGELAHRAYDKIGEYGTVAHEQYDHHIEEHPLAVGAVALALGAAVGFAIPSTRYEGELMGKASQNFLQKAQDSAGDMVERVKQIASEAGETLKSEIKDKGTIH